MFLNGGNRGATHRPYAFCYLPGRYWRLTGKGDGLGWGGNWSGLIEATWGQGCHHTTRVVCLYHPTLTGCNSPVSTSIKFPNTSLFPPHIPHLPLQTNQHQLNFKHIPWNKYITVVENYFRKEGWQDCPPVHQSPGRAAQPHYPDEICADVLNKEPPPTDSLCGNRGDTNS